MQEIIIHFSGVRPSIARILDAFQHRTGLLLGFEVDEDEAGADLISDEYNCGFRFELGDNSINILTGLGASSFPLWALISTLKHLGAVYDGPIPEYADKRWDELSDESKEEVKRQNLEVYT